jgi:hypothetical protein
MFILLSDLVQILGCLSGADRPWSVQSPDPGCAIQPVASGAAMLFPVELKGQAPPVESPPVGGSARLSAGDIIGCLNVQVIGDAVDTCGLHHAIGKEHVGPIVVELQLQRFIGPMYEDSSWKPVPCHANLHLECAPGACRPTPPIHVAFRFHHQYSSQAREKRVTGAQEDCTNCRCAV